MSINSFQSGYDYLTNYFNDSEDLIFDIKSILDLGDQIFKNTNFNNAKEIIKLDNFLMKINQLLIKDLCIFCFRWNECFSKTFGFDSKNKFNWFYFGSELNNYDKHLNREILNFEHGYFNPNDFLSKSEKNEIYEKISKCRKSIYSLKHCIDSVLLSKKVAYSNFCEHNNKSMIKPHFNDIKNIKEFYEIRDVFFPNYFPYFNFLWKTNERPSKKLCINDAKILIKELITYDGNYKNIFFRDQWKKLKIKFEKLIKLIGNFYLVLKEKDINDYKKFANSNFNDNLNGSFNFLKN